MQAINCSNLKLKLFFLAFGISDIFSIVTRSLPCRRPCTQEERHHAKTGTRTLGSTPPLVLQDTKSHKIPKKNYTGSLTTLGLDEPDVYIYLIHTTASDSSVLYIRYINLSQRRINISRLH